MNRVDIHYEGINTLDKEKKIRLLCGKIFDILKIDNWELSIVICNDLFIKNLNREYRGKDEATDVLSFPQIDDDCLLFPDGIMYAGDVIISIETLKRNSFEFNVDINEEFKRLLTHGILHLKGYDHEDNSPEQEMLIFQEELLKKLTGVKVL